MNGKMIFVMFLTCIFVLSCAPDQLPQATFATVATATLTPSLTEIPSATAPTPLDLGIETEKVVDFFSDQFTFRNIENIDNLPAIKGTTTSGFSNIFLIGHPYLAKAEITIELGSENQDQATSYWINLLKLTTQDATDAADWVHANYREAALQGKALEHNFGSTKIILKVDNGINPYFMLTVMPINKTQQSS